MSSNTLRNALPKRKIPLPPLKIIYRDKGILVVDKPAGLDCQDAADSPLSESEPSSSSGANNTGPSIRQHFHNLARRLELAPEDRIRTVHRLDKPTTGPLLLALNPHKAVDLCMQFRKGLVKKSYLAIVSKYIPPDAARSGTNTAFLAKRDGYVLSTQAPSMVSRLTSPTARRQAITNPHLDTPLSKSSLLSTPPSKSKKSGGEPIDYLDPSHNNTRPAEAITQWEFIAGSSELNISLVRLWPLTGHKHQLRLFASEQLGAPIIGDKRFGFPSRDSINRHEIYRRKPASLDPDEDGLLPTVDLHKAIQSDQLFLHCESLGFFRFAVNSAGKNKRVFEIVRSDPFSIAGNSGWRALADAMEDRELNRASDEMLNLWEGGYQQYDDGVDMGARATAEGNPDPSIIPTPGKGK